MLTSFINNNPWFNGQVDILTLESDLLSDHNINIFKTIYSDINILSISDSSISKLNENVNNRAKYSNILDYLKIFTFKIESGGNLYISRNTVINGDLSKILDKSKVSIASSSESFPNIGNYVNGNLMFVPSKHISEENFSRAYDILTESVLNGTFEYLNLFMSTCDIPITKLPSNILVNASIFPNSKYPNFIRYSKSISAILIEPNILNSDKHSRIHTYWNQLMHNAQRILNTPSRINNANLIEKNKVHGKKIDVNSHLPEFGYELISILPYCYHLYKNNRLGDTVSGLDTECLYFFNSDNHTEVIEKRGWENMPKLWNIKFPNIGIHTSDLDLDKFSPPPLKEHYNSKKIVFEKETIVICNRYNMEWGGDPINYLDLDTLIELFDLLKDEYQIVYINLKGDDRYYDGAPPLDLGDFNLIRKRYSDVIIIQDLLKDYNTTFNDLQMRIFAGCSRFITSNGGQAILTSYFGGENIIFTKKCRELLPEVNSFYRWYHKFGNSIIKVVNKENELIEIVKSKWINKDPLINILIRTSGRPNYFKSCMDSIYNQTYKNWNIIVGVDDKISEKYIQPHSCIMVSYNFDSYKIPPPPPDLAYGIKFKYNMYLNELHKYVQDGYIMYIDDDDSLYNIKSLENISSNLKNNDLMFWRVSFPNRLVPSDDNFSKEIPIMKDISSIGFIFRNDIKEEWEAYKRGDYRIAKKLFDKSTNTKWVNETFTGLQRVKEDGFGRKDDKK